MYIFNGQKLAFKQICNKLSGLNHFAFTTGNSLSLRHYDADLEYSESAHHEMYSPCQLCILQPKQGESLIYTFLEALQCGSWVQWVSKDVLGMPTMHSTTEAGRVIYVLHFRSMSPIWTGIFKKDNLLTVESFEDELTQLWHCFIVFAFSLGCQCQDRVCIILQQQIQMWIVMIL